MDWSSPILSGFVGSLVAGLGTGAGALPIFVRKGWSKNARRLMLAFAGGMNERSATFAIVLGFISMMALTVLLG